MHKREKVSCTKKGDNFECKLGEILEVKKVNLQI